MSEQFIGLLLLVLGLAGTIYGLAYYSTRKANRQELLKELHWQPQPPSDKPTPTFLTPIELDALLEKVVRFTNADLPHLTGYVALARSVLNIWPPTKEVADWTEGSLIQNFKRIVSDFPYYGRTSALTRTFQSEDDWAPDTYKSFFLSMITAGPDGNKTSPMGLGQANHPVFNDIQNEILRLFSLPIPIPYTDAKRFEHTQIVGGTGAGKTTLLSHIILHDLHKPDPPCIILLDPKNLVIPKLSKLALFDPDTGPLKDRLIILSPEHRPAINIFDNTGRGTAGAIDSLKYLCAALSTEFTTLQEGLAANVARLLLVFPQTVGRNATLNDLRALMVDKFPEGDYRKAVAGLRPIQQEFFAPGGFDNTEYRDAKRQIRRRLDQMIGSEHLESLFFSQRNAINIAEEMQKGSIILVDCAERLMDSREEASAFGCVFIAEVLRAIMQRNALPEDQRRPCFLFVDEAATFFRGDMNYFFEGARQCRVGGTFAFHYLSQSGVADLRETMMVMTSTKLLSGRSKDDAPAFARHMGYSSPTDFSAFLDSLPPYHFALSIAGVQDKAVGISAPPGELDAEPPMSDAAYARFIAANRKRVSGGQQQQQQSAPPPPPPGGSTKWTGPKPEWTQADELDLSDCLHQQAIAGRRGDTERWNELEERIQKLKAKKAAAQENSGTKEDAYWAC